MRPDVTAFFDPATNTVSYVVADPATGRAAIVDSVLDYDPNSARTSTSSADQIIAHVEARKLEVDWLLETHIHADHLTAAPYLQQRLGGRIGIGVHIREVQTEFGRLFDAEPGFVPDGHQFDHLFEDGETFAIGKLTATALHTPGHTAADLTYVIGDAAFMGDTLFQPDYGTARTDFPGGSATTLYRSIRRILDLPPTTRLFTGHDYTTAVRETPAWESSVATQRAHNVHVHDGVDEDAFVALRRARDAQLPVPKLILPSVQVNIRAGHLPPPADNGRRYLKIPVDTI